jgi:hypothetical protein
MNNNYQKVKDYLLELGHSVIKEVPEDGLLVIDHESEGVKNFAICCTDTVLVMEQFIFSTKNPDSDMYRSLLQKNRDIIHGAFVLDESGKKVIFRDTLQIENLDLNEIEGSINSLALLLLEYRDSIIKFSKN